MSLSQSEAVRLLAIPKEVMSKTIIFPNGNSILTLDVQSKDKKESFLLDINRKGKINITRCTLYHRYNTIIGLARLDLDEDKDHTNPDGKKITGPHIHVYRESFGIRWAYSLNEYKDYKFDNTKDLVDSFVDFCRYCNIEYSYIQGSGI